MLNKILLTLFICSSLLAQKKQIDEISYEQANDIQFFVNIKNGTRAEAIAKLKESKELLELELLSEDEYNEIKAELAPIIKNKS